MPATKRLYYENSHLLEFEARVVDVADFAGKLAVVLDETAFYPTGGGQPNDTGQLGEARVVDCIEAEDSSVLHLIEGMAPSTGEMVKGSIDRSRRLDHIQQHTGQHILSAAFVNLFDAATHGFRMLDQVCEIDVALENPSEDRIQQAVDLANQIVWEDRVATIRTVTPEEAAALPLRKAPSVAGELRLIEIPGFDLTPCGGTHAHRTGEVGVIATRSWERAKGLTRIEFVAGGRALADYRRANETARKTAALFSAGRDDAFALAQHMQEENKELHRRVRVLEEIAANVEAAELRENSAGSDPIVIAKVFEDRDAESLKRLALALVARPQTIALLGSRDGEAARLIFARSADAPGDMNALMRKACETIEGRGGGKPDMAQGGGKDASKLVEAIEVAVKSVA
jgi:alanyl-tRNA synthetase